MDDHCKTVLLNSKDAKRWDLLMKSNRRKFVFSVFSYAIFQAVLALMSSYMFMSGNLALWAVNHPQSMVFLLMLTPFLFIGMYFGAKSVILRVLLYLVGSLLVAFGYGYLCCFISPDIVCQTAWLHLSVLIVLLAFIEFAGDVRQPWVWFGFGFAWLMLATFMDIAIDLIDSVPVLQASLLFYLWLLVYSVRNASATRIQYGWAILFVPEIVITNLFFCIVPVHDQPQPPDYFC